MARTWQLFFLSVPWLNNWNSTWWSRNHPWRDQRNTHRWKAVRQRIPRGCRDKHRGAHRRQRPTGQCCCSIRFGQPPQTCLKKPQRIGNQTHHPWLSNLCGWSRWGWSNSRCRGLQSWKWASYLAERWAVSCLPWFLFRGEGILDNATRSDRKVGWGWGEQRFGWADWCNRRLWR